MVRSGLRFGGDSAGPACGVEVSVGRNREAKVPPTCGPSNRIIGGSGPLPALPHLYTFIPDMPWGSNIGVFFVKPFCLYRRTTKHQITPGRWLGRTTGGDPPKSLGGE